MDKTRYNKEYDDVPVHFCNKCGSLAIMTDDYGSFCSDCSCSDVKTTDIETWENYYKERYGRYYINK